MTVLITRTSIVGGSSGFTPQSGYTLTGTPGQGNSLTITKSGGGFGSGPSTVLDDRVSNIAAYSGLTEGSTIPTTSGYPYADNSPLHDDVDKVKYSQLNLRHSNQTANYKMASGGALEWPRAFGGTVPPDGQDKMYLRFWLCRVDTGTGGAGESTKVGRIWDKESGLGTRISFGRLGGAGLDVNNADPGFSGGGGSPTTFTVGLWNLFELYAGIGDGVFGYQNNALNSRQETNSFKDQSSLSLGFNIKDIGYDTGGVDPTRCNWQMSDIYVADSRARVTISDNATWSSVTSSQEAQIPTSWADGSITFTNLFGQFGSSLSGKHLHVHTAADSHLYAGQFN